MTLAETQQQIAGAVQIVVLLVWGLIPIAMAVLAEAR